MSFRMNGVASILRMLLMNDLYKKNGVFVPS